MYACACIETSQVMFCCRDLSTGESDTLDVLYQLGCSWPCWKPCCWVGSAGADPVGAKPRVVAPWGPGAMEMLGSPGWTGQCWHCLMGPSSACARGASLASGCLFSGLQDFWDSYCLYCSDQPSAFVVVSWMAPLAQKDNVLWYRKARVWVEIVIPY